MEIDVELGLKLAASTEKISEELDKANRFRRWIPRRLSAAIVASGAGQFKANLGAPADGRLWNPVSLSIAGALPLLAPDQLTRFAFFMGDYDNPTPSQVILVQDNFGTNFFTFGTEALWTTNTESCFMLGTFAGATTLFVNLQVREYRQDDIMPRYL